MPLSVGGAIDLATATWRDGASPLYLAFITILKHVPIPDRLKKEEKHVSQKQGDVVLLFSLFSLLICLYLTLYPKGLPRGVGTATSRSP